MRRSVAPKELQSDAFRPQLYAVGADGDAVVMLVCCLGQATTNYCLRELTGVRTPTFLFFVSARACVFLLCRKAFENFLAASITENCIPASCVSFAFAQPFFCTGFACAVIATRWDERGGGAADTREAVA